MSRGILAMVLAGVCCALAGSCTPAELKTQAQVDRDADAFCAGLPRARAERAALESLARFTPDAASGGAAGAP